MGANQITDDIDEWFIDVKDLNPNIYKAYTGKDNDTVISNLNKMIEVVPKDKIMIRVPHIANFNTIDNVKQSIEELKTIGFSKIDEFEYIIP